MTDGYYLLMCNYSNANDYSNLIYEALIQIKNDSIFRYTLHNEVHDSTKFDFILIKDSKENKCVIEKNEIAIKDYLCGIYPDLEARKNATFIFKKTFLNAGEYHPNMYRPFLSYRYLNEKLNLRLTNIEELENVLFTEFSLFSEAEYLSRLNQLELLLEDLSIIFQTIEPTKNNMSCYGHKIRNLIILACTEVDSICKNILVANDYPSKKMYKTDDYILLQSPLKLDHYEIEFVKHPEIRKRSPFRNWNSSKPTQSLIWYDAYNQIKHDRINNYERATLEYAIDSISAIVILLLAQYGDNNIFWKDKMYKYFNLSKKPKWDFDDLYIPPIHPHKTGEVELQEKKYNFI